MNTQKMTLAEQKYLMNTYPNRVVLPYIKLSTDMACWLLENPSDFHDEVVARYNAGEIYYNDLVELLEREQKNRKLLDISEMGKIVNRKTGTYFTEGIEPESSVNIKTITQKDIKDAYFVGWITALSDNDEISGGFLLTNPQHNAALIHQPKNNNHGYGVWVDDKLEAVVRIDTTLKIKYLWSFFVNPSNQESRIGSLLMNYIISIFGNDPIRLDVHIDNDRAIRMYRGFGFEITYTNKDMAYHTMTRKATERYD